MLCGESVAFPRPAHRFCRNRVRDPPAVELALGFIESVTAFDEAQGKPSSPSPMLGAGPACVDEADVLDRQSGWKAFDLRTVEWWEAMPNLQFLSTGNASGTEPARSLQRSGKCAVSPPVVPDPELCGNISEVDLGCTSAGVELIGERPKQQCGGRPEDSQPEAFDVARPSVMAELIDQRIVPASNVEHRQMRLIARQCRLQRHRSPSWSLQNRGSGIYNMIYHAFT